MPETFSDSLGMRLRRAYLALHRRTNAELRKGFGATADQFVVMTLLAEQSPASQQELAARCGSDASTMGALVRLLETKGWVRRTPDPSDRRAWQVRLTRTGRGLQTRMARAAEQSFHRDLWSVLDSARSEKAVLRALDQIAGRMNGGGRQ